MTEIFLCIVYCHPIESKVVRVEVVWKEQKASSRIVTPLRLSGALRKGGLVAEAAFSQLTASVWVAVVLREILRSHTGSVGKSVLEG